MKPKLVIRCADFDAAQRFYAGVLALSPIEQWDEPRGRGCVFATDAGLIEISQLTPEDPRFTAALTRPLSDDKVDLQIEVASLDDWIARLGGVWPFDGPETLPWGQRWILLRDPDRLKVALYEELRPTRADDIRLSPVGRVRSPRRDLSDDAWGGVVSTIELDAAQFPVASTAGLAEFSHVEVVYQFHRVPAGDVEKGARHPRGRSDWPRVGIFAQRAKARTNRIGLCTCRLLAVDGLRLEVRGLDAIDGTPVLDVKPYLRELAPREPVSQPDWVAELMARYFE